MNQEKQSHLQTQKQRSLTQLEVNYFQDFSKHSTVTKQRNSLTKSLKLQMFAWLIQLQTLEQEMKDMHVFFTARIRQDLKSFTEFSTWSCKSLVSKMTNTQSKYLKSQPTLNQSKLKFSSKIKASVTWESYIQTFSRLIRSQILALFSNWTWSQYSNTSKTAVNFKWLIN